MSRFVPVVLILCLAAAVAGTAVPGLFWLTVVAVGGVLVAGAFAVSLPSRGVEDAEAADCPGPSDEPWAEPTPLDTRRRRQDGGDVSRAA